MSEILPSGKPDTRAQAHREWLERVFREHYADLSVFVCRYVWRDDRAQDIVKDLFHSIWPDPERWMNAGDALRRLLMVAARNRAIDYLRRRRVGEQHALRVTAERGGDAASTMDAEMLQREIQRDIEKAIAALPERARQIFLLSRRDGLTYGEIAGRSVPSNKTVKAGVIR